MADLIAEEFGIESLFNWQSSTRTFNIDLGIKIPQDAPPGGREVLITAKPPTPKTEVGRAR